jgi:hypothetical protein
MYRVCVLQCCSSCPCVQTGEYPRSFFFLGVWLDWVHLVHLPLFGLFYQLWMMDDNEFGMKFGHGDWSTLRNPALVSLCPPQISHDLTWEWTQASAVRSRRLNPELWHSRLGPLWVWLRSGYVKYELRGKQLAVLMRQLLRQACVAGTVLRALQGKLDASVLVCINRPATRGSAGTGYATGEWMNGNIGYNVGVSACAYVRVCARACIFEPKFCCS